METQAPIPPEALLEHAGFLRALARRLLDKDEADDVVQDTMLAALRRPPRDRSRLRQWLGAVARRLALQKRRSAGRRVRRERGSGGPSGLPSPSDVAAQLEAQRRVVDAVMALDEPYRSTVVHRFFHDRSVKEIAAELDVPQKTVESRLTRALRRLRGRLDKDYGDRRSWCAALLPLAAPSAAAAATAGVIVLGAKVKAGLAAAAVVVAGAGVWTVRHVDRAPPVAPKREIAREAEVAPLPEPPRPAAAPVRVVREARAAIEDHAETWTEGVIDGVVTTEDGAPVPEGTVAYAERGDEVVKAGVAPDGRYELKGLSATAYRVTIIAPGYAPARTRVYLATNPRQPRMTWPFRIHRGSTLRVVAPIGMAMELVGGPKARPPGAVVAGALGRAGWKLLADGRYTLRFELDGVEQTWGLRLDKKETVELTIAVGTVVTGSVHDANGEPVVGADVLLGGVVRTSVKTDEHGRYRAPALPPDTYHVTVSGRGFAARGGTFVVEGRAVTDHVVGFGPPSVSGTVTGGDEGTTGVRLSPLYANVDDEGRYVFWNVPAGKHVLKAWPGRTDYTQPEREVEIRAGESLAGIDFEVGPNRYGAIEMEIRNADGTMPESIQAYVGTRRVSTSMAPERIAPGRFRLRLTTGLKTVNLDNRVTFEVEIVEGRTLYRSIQLPRAAARNRATNFRSGRAAK